MRIRGNLRQDTDSTRTVSTRRRHGQGIRQAVELAVLFVAAGTVNLVAGAGSHAAISYALIAVAAFVVLGTWAVRWWRRRGDLSPEPSTPEFQVSGVDNRAANLWRLRAEVNDSPGRLARLTEGLAALGGDIRTVRVHPKTDGAVDDVVLHAPVEVTAEELRHAVTVAGGREVTAVRADVEELDDIPTKALTVAIDLIRGRSELVRALSVVLGEVEVLRQDMPDPGLEAGDLADDTMCVVAPEGGVLVLRRPGASFTPAEFARARAMAELAASCCRHRRLGE